MQLWTHKSLDIGLFERTIVWSWTHENVFVRSWSDYRAFKKAYVQTIVRSKLHMSRLSCVQSYLWSDYRAFQVAYVQTIVRSKLHMSRLSCVQNCICPDYRAFKIAYVQTIVRSKLHMSRLSCVHFFFPDRVILNARRHLVRSFRSGHIDFRSGTSTWGPLVPCHAFEATWSWAKWNCNFEEQMRSSVRALTKWVKQCNKSKLTKNGNTSTITRARKNTKKTKVEKKQQQLKDELKEKSSSDSRSVVDAEKGQSSKKLGRTKGVENIRWNVPICQTWSPNDTIQTEKIVNQEQREYLIIFLAKSISSQVPKAYFERWNWAIITNKKLGREFVW